MLKYNKEASDGNYRVLAHVDNQIISVKPSSLEKSGLKGLVPSLIGILLRLLQIKCLKLLWVWMFLVKWMFKDAYHQLN